MWLNGVYHPFFEKHCDFTPFDVGGMTSRIESRTGALISEIRAYKLGRRLNMTFEARLDNDLDCAVHMAFDHQQELPGYGNLGGPSQFIGSRVFSPLTEFFREYNDRYFTGVDNVADVAVLRSWPSMAYSIGGTIIPTILMEQVLIQYKVPFDIITDERIGTIGRYRAVVLPEQESLSGDTVDRLIAYARNGGTVVFTGRTAAYNERRERRAVNPLLSLFPPESGKRISARVEGKGRLVYVQQVALARGARVSGDASDDNPEIEAPKNPGSQRFLPAEWTLPENHQAIYHAVSDHLPEGLSIRTEAPLTTVMELLNRGKSRQTIVHFVNFERKKAAGAFAVKLKKQFPGEVTSVSYFSPDVDDPKPLEFKEASGAVNFTVPPTRLYGMVVVSHNATGVSR
jgi:hypothetical protein